MEAENWIPTCPEFSSRVPDHMKQRRDWPKDFVTFYIEGLALRSAKKFNISK